MNNELRPATQSPFDSIRQTKGSREFWSARDLQTLLGYTEWRNFEKTIKKAIAACRNVRQNPEDHFVDTNKIVEAGATNKPITDYHLTRYACYLTAMNGDPEKEEIAQAQTYFAIKTYEAEQQSPPRVQQTYVREVEERLQRLEQEVENLKQVGQRPRLASKTRTLVPVSEEEARAKVAKRVLAFLQWQEEPVSRRTITKYGHSCVAIIEPILDELVASGQVSRVKIPGSRVQWFYQLSGNDNLRARHTQGLDT